MRVLADICISCINNTREKRPRKRSWLSHRGFDVISERGSSPLVETSVLTLGNEDACAIRAGAPGSTSVSHGILSMRGEGQIVWTPDVQGARFIRCLDGFCASQAGTAIARHMDICERQKRNKPVQTGSWLLKTYG